MRIGSVLVYLVLALASGAVTAQATPDLDGLVAVNVPSDDPGPPFYARVSPIMNELFFSNDWLVIPFYREPDCIPPEFNLFDLYHFPSADGPGAFGCPLLVEGVAHTEPDAAPTTFPKYVSLQGEGDVPIWFVRRDAFERATADATLTMPELRALDPRIGSASTFVEELWPRTENHRIEITSRGTIDDGRSFGFDLVHVGESIEEIDISFR